MLASFATFRTQWIQAFTWPHDDSYLNSTCTWDCCHGKLTENQTLVMEPPRLNFYSKQNTKHKNKHSDTRINTFANMIFITNTNWQFCFSFSFFSFLVQFINIDFLYTHERRALNRLCFIIVTSQQISFSWELFIRRKIPISFFRYFQCQWRRKHHGLSGISGHEDNLTKGASQSSKKFRKIRNSSK